MLRNHSHNVLCIAAVISLVGVAAIWVPWAGTTTHLEWEYGRHEIIDRSNRIEFDRVIDLYPSPVSIASPKGLFAVGREGGVVQVREMASGRLVSTVKSYNSFEHNDALAISDDGTRLATSSNGKVELWDVGSGKLISMYNSPARRLTFAEDGDLLLIHSPAQSILTFAGGELKEKETLDQNWRFAGATDDGRWLLGYENANDRKETYIASLRRKREFALFRSTGDQTVPLNKSIPLSAERVSSSEDGRVVVATLRPGVHELFISGDMLNAVGEKLRSSLDGANFVAVRSDGKQVAAVFDAPQEVASNRFVTRCYDLSGSLLSSQAHDIDSGELTEGMRNRFYDFDGSSLFISGYGGLIYPLSIFQGSVNDVIDASLGGFSCSAVGVDDLGDTALFALGTQTGNFELWEYPSGEQKVKIKVGKSPIKWVFLSSQVHEAVAVDVDGGVFLLGLSGPTLVRQFSVDLGENSLIASDKSCSRLATVSADGDLRVFATKSGTQICSVRLKLPGEHPHGIAMSGDGSMVAICGRLGTAALADLEDLSDVSITSLDGRRALGSRDELWEFDRKLEQTAVRSGVQRSLIPMSFSPTGDCLIAGNVIWNTSTAKVIKVWHGEPVNFATFGRGGEYLLGFWHGGYGGDEVPIHYKDGRGRIFQPLLGYYGTMSKLFLSRHRVHVLCVNRVLHTFELEMD